MFTAPIMPRVDSFQKHRYPSLSWPNQRYGPTGRPSLRIPDEITGRAAQTSIIWPGKDNPQLLYRAIKLKSYNGQARRDISFWTCGQQRPTETTTNEGVSDPVTPCSVLDGWSDSGFATDSQGVARVRRQVEQHHRFRRERLHVELLVRQLMICRQDHMQEMPIELQASELTRHIDVIHDREIELAVHKTSIQLILSLFVSVDRNTRMLIIESG
jgi:hypothetical protein